MVSPLGAAGSKVRAQPNIWLAVRGVVRCANSLGTAHREARSYTC